MFATIQISKFIFARGVFIRRKDDHHVEIEIDGKRPTGICLTPAELTKEPKPNLNSVN